MIVYIFGNRDLPEDNAAFQVAEALINIIDNVQFMEVKPNEDLPFDDRQDVVIMDSVLGIEKAEVFDESHLDQIQLPPRSSAHDFDLAFQLKYLKKLGKLGKITIIALPIGEKIDYSLIQSILRKLVAQDIQGS